MTQSTMTRMFAAVLALMFIVTAAPVRAERADRAMREDVDGILESDEYRVISMDGGVTRRPCPYTCEMRGIAREQCKEWPSKRGNECYVQDTTRRPDVMALEPSEEKESRAAYRPQP